MTIYQDIFVFFMIIWLVALFFWLIRKGIEPIYKIIPLLIFLFYIWKEHRQFALTWKELQKNYIEFIFNFIIHLSAAIFQYLPLAWSIILVIGFYMIEEVKTEKILKVLIYITALSWTIWLLNLFFGESIGPFFRRHVRDFLP